MEYKRLENESWIQFADRIVSAKENGLIDIDKTEIYEMLFGDKLSSDESRKRLYSVKKVIEILKNEKYKSISDDSVLTQVKNIVGELDIKKQQIRDQNRQLNSLNKVFSLTRLMIIYHQIAIHISQFCQYQLNHFL